MSFFGGLGGAGVGFGGGALGLTSGVAVELGGALVPVSVSPDVGVGVLGAVSFAPESPRPHPPVLAKTHDFKRAKGCKAMTLQKSHENPSRYRLFVQWETVENHTVDFRGSADFQEWRKLVGHCFASPPEVEHVKEVVKGF